ncbi:MAG: lysophospholipid acyltransferase family protein [Clostridium sp.]
MKILKGLYYGFYMINMRLKGIKYNYILKSKGEAESFYYAQKVFEDWSIFTAKVIGMDIETIGRENIPNEPCVFMANHQSILDIPILKLSTQSTMAFVAKKELLKIPVIGYWIKKSYSVPLNRENPREAIKVITEGVKNIKKGYNMAIFPEGTRSEDCSIVEFKKGSMKLATKAKVPIVPITIEGTRACFEETRKFLPGKIRVVIGKPIETKELTKEEEATLNILVRQKVEEGLK